MDFKMFLVSVSVMVVLQIMGMSSAIKIKIDPETYNTDDHTNVKVTCLLDDAEAAIQDIYLIKIARKGERAIVLLHRNNSITYSAGNAQEFPSTGNVAKPAEDSTLKMTITTPDPEDSGSYTCTVYYTSGFGSLRENKASSYLTVNDPELKLLNSSIKAVLDKLQKGQDQILNLATQVAESKSKVDDLETISEKQTKNIKDLADKENDVEKKMADLDTKTKKQIKDMTDDTETSVQDLKDKMKRLEDKIGNGAGGGTSKQTKELVQGLQSTVQKQAQTIIDLAQQISDFDRKMKNFKDEMKRKLDQLAKPDDKDDDFKIDFLNVKDRTEQQTKQIKDLTEKANDNEGEIRKLDGIAKVMAGKIENNKKKVNDFRNSKSSVAFHVTSGLYNMYPIKDAPLKFNEVILNQGQGFNKNSGIFTAPVGGIYAFNLYLQVPCYGCKIEVTIVANTKVLSRYSGGSQKDRDQHAISAVAYLNVGDTVKAVVTYVGNKDWSLGYFRKSAFNGFLV